MHGGHATGGSKPLSVWVRSTSTLDSAASMMSMHMPSSNSETADAGVQHVGRLPEGGSTSSFVKEDHGTLSASSDTSESPMYMHDHEPSEVRTESIASFEIACMANACILRLPPSQC